MSAFLDKLGQVPLLYHPGERWMYSLATDICGALVEVIGPHVTPEHVADHARTNAYEVMTALGRRYHRAYVDRFAEAPGDETGEPA